MNTETINDNTAPQSTGTRLRMAREELGLTQQSVAERLCLKLSMINAIEEDEPCEVSPAFLRGYVRSYARLVRVAEEDLLIVLDDEQTAMIDAGLRPAAAFDFSKGRKKQDNWLMIFTWLIVFIVVGLTGLWWWQNHKAVQNVSDLPVRQDNAVSRETGHSPQTRHNDAPKTAVSSASSPSVVATADQTTSSDSNRAKVTPIPAASPVNVANVSGSDVTSAMPMAKEHSGVSAHQTEGSETEKVASVPVDSSAISLFFNDECWLEVIDGKGKKLFSGLQVDGDKLILSGSAPYHLSVGAPAAVQIQFQGEAVDLSHFIRSNRVARLTLGAR